MIYFSSRLAQHYRYGLIIVITLIMLGLDFVSFTVSAQAVEMETRQKIIIAHRGASGYLPEHTLAAKVLAVGMGSDYIEQDIVLSRDGIPVVLHDLYLDAVSNVAQVFPDRHREDGKFYVIDFDLAELKQLGLNERIDPATSQPRYPGRFPVALSAFRIATLAEEIEMIQGLNHSMNRNIGIYPEIKSPAWHRQQGYDISDMVLTTLSKYGYLNRSDNIYLQSFDPDELKRIRIELGSELKLVQLIGENDWNEADTDYNLMRTAEGIRAIADYADGIGPAVSHIINIDDSGLITMTRLVAMAHRHNLPVHPYTARRDNLPDHLSSFDELLELLLVKANVDGVFTDFPDLAVQFRDTHRQ
jgi:glycerophosphoryl diester phosphodiesterase